MEIPIPTELQRRNTGQMVKNIRPYIWRYYNNSFVRTFHKKKLCMHGTCAAALFGVYLLSRGYFIGENFHVNTEQV